jgi:hypothetical protein
MEYQISFGRRSRVHQPLIANFFLFHFHRSSKIPASPYNGSLLTNGNVEQQNQQTPAKQSMLGKLKLFGKDKTEIPKTQLSKRTSSSSGFSSARSERSDSSISLNNDSNIPSSQTTSTSSTKSSKKCEASKPAKTTSKVPAAKAATNTKKDKSQMSRSTSGESHNGISVAVDSPPPTKMHKIPQAKLQVQVGRKPETATTKTGSVPSTKLQSPSVGTGIPKPMAAIKGTTKQAAPDESLDAIKVDSRTQIVAPITMSPHHNQLLHQTSETIHSHANPSEASVIYRPATGGENHVDIYQMQSQTNPISGRKLETFNDPSLINGHKFASLAPKVNGTIFEEDKDVSAIVPMRSLMRSGYNSCTTSPLRTARMGSNGYYEDGSLGYCSDGDALRKSAPTIRYSDIENGYLSEGPHFLSILRNNRPQMPSTIAEER